MTMRLWQAGLSDFEYSVKDEMCYYIAQIDGNIDQQTSTQTTFYLTSILNDDYETQEFEVVDTCSTELITIPCII